MQAGRAQADAPQGGHQVHSEEEPGRDALVAHLSRDRHHEVARSQAHRAPQPGHGEQEHALLGVRVRGQRRDIRLHTAAWRDARGARVRQVRADLIGRRVLPQQERGASRPQEREPAPRRPHGRQAGRLRLRQPLRHAVAVEDVLRLAAIRCARDLHRPEVLRPRGGRVEHGRHTLRARHRSAALRLREPAESQAPRPRMQGMYLLGFEI